MSAPDLLRDLASRTLLVVSGKGGVGKTAVASALGALAARQGRSVLLVSTDGRGDAAALFGREDRGYAEAPLAENLRAITTDFDALLDGLRPRRRRPSASSATACSPCRRSASSPGRRRACPTFSSSGRSARC